MSERKHYIPTPLGFLIIIIIAGLINFLLLVFYVFPIETVARDANRENDLRIIQLAVKIYYQKNNQYPQDIRDLTLIHYLNDIPTDPKTGVVYIYFSNGEDYEINAVLEKNSARMKNDGGNDDHRYEVGTNLTLISS